MTYTSTRKNATERDVFLSRSISLVFIGVTFLSARDFFFPYFVLSCLFFFPVNLKHHSCVSVANLMALQPSNATYFSFSPPDYQLIFPFLSISFCLQERDMKIPIFSFENDDK